MGPRTGLDDVKRARILLLQDSNSDPSAVQPVGSRYTDCVIPALEKGTLELLNLKY
jgi:hypothetical protein